MVLMILFLFGLLASVSQASADVLNKLSATKLNVHLVAHSHDDPGWLKTADQYFTGSNSSIYRASVQYIFNSVIDELKKSPERKFTFCEISFFERWWHDQDEFTKATVRRMIQSEQLSFVNGGWVMHDEASAHYVSMIDQTTLGHQFLLKELNYRPRVGWQIDPFGHSNTHSWLSSEVGFDALFFGRIDYQDRAKRMAEQSMEFIWKGSKSQSDAEVFTGAFSDGNYAPPKGFCIDTNCPYCKDDPVVSDPLLETYNLDEKVQLFIQGILAEQKIARGNNIMLRMGADFVYQNAQAWYRSIDKLIQAINERDQRFNLFYSDPTSYMRARAQENDVVWHSKTDDFFPYSDFSHVSSNIAVYRIFYLMTVSFLFVIGFLGRILHFSSDFEVLRAYFIVLSANFEANCCDSWFACPWN
jgi:alpha-mannosidase